MNKKISWVNSETSNLHHKHTRNYVVLHSHIRISLEQNSMTLSNVHRKVVAPISHELSTYSGHLKKTSDAIS